jgi:hypothetical protein
MSTIGSASLVLSTNSAKLVSGLDQAGDKVKGWATQTSSAVSSKLGNFKAGAAFGAGLIAVQGLLGEVGGAISKFGELNANMDKVAKLSRNLGMPTESLSGLQHAAGLSGVSMETLEAGLLKFRQKATGPLDEALYALAERLEGITDPGERARILVENFGKTGVNMGTLFEGGEAGLRGMVEEAKKLGIAFNAADAAKIEAANDAITKVKGAISGVVNQFLIKAAPVIELVGTKLTQAFEFLMPVFDRVFRALSTHWGIIIDILGEVFGAIGEVIQAVVGWVSELFNLEQVSLTVEEVVTGVWKATAIGAAYVWDTIKAGAGAVAWVAGLIVEGFGYVVEAFKEVVSLAKELPDAIRPAWLDSLVDGVTEFEGAVKKSGKDLRNWGEGTIKGFGDSADKVRNWFDKRKKKEDPKEDGKAGIGEAPEDKKATYTAVAAALKASKEAISIEARWRTNNMLNPAKDINKQQLLEAQKANKLLNDVVKAISGIDLGLEAI